MDGFQHGAPIDGPYPEAAMPPAEYPGFNVSESTITSSANYDELMEKALQALKEFHPSKMYLSEDQNIALEKIDFHLKKAMVNHLLGETESHIKDAPPTGVYGDISKLYDKRQEDAYRLAYIIRPRIELIYDLKRHADKFKRIMGDPSRGIPMDPDYKRCIFKLDTTLEYLKQDVGPHIQEFIELTGGPGLGGLEGFGSSMGDSGLSSLGLEGLSGFGSSMGSMGFEGLSPFGSSGMYGQRGYQTDLEKGMPGPHQQKGIEMLSMMGGNKRARRPSSKRAPVIRF